MATPSTPLIPDRSSTPSVIYLILATFVNLLVSIEKGLVSSFEGNFIIE